MGNEKNQAYPFLSMTFKTLENCVENYKFQLQQNCQLQCLMTLSLPNITCKIVSYFRFFFSWQFTERPAKQS